MEPVNITDAKTWSSVDIFLFSNGQQYSPPRKYHLRSEDLQWWANTVSYLGRTHYGSGHSSIHLYTVEGKKINGPLELVNGAAYVAVEPPDSFLDAGYEEYLVRASRSFQKRLAQKLNPENLNLENTNSKIKESPDVPGIPLITEEIVTSTAGNDISLKKNSQSYKPQPCLQRKAVSKSKTIQRKTSLDKHHPSIKRISTEADKNFPCPRKMSMKTKESSNRKMGTSFPRYINKTSLENNQNLGKCDNTKNIEIKTDQSSDKNCELLPLKPGSYAKTNAKENCDTGPHKEKPIVSLYETKESDLASVKTDPDIFSVTNQSLAQEIKDNNDTLDAVNQRNEKLAMNLLKQTHESEHNKIPVSMDLDNNPQLKKVYNDKVEIPANENYKTNSNMKYYNDDTLSINSVNVSEKQVTDEYIACMRKGGLLLLKLKIKLKDCKTFYNKERMKSSHITTSLTNLSKIDKTSQVDININISGELIKASDKNDNNCKQNKSLQSLLNKIKFDSTDNYSSKNPKIIILQCACQDYAQKDDCSMNVTTCKCGGENIECNTIQEQRPNEVFTRFQSNDRAFQTSKDEDNNMKNNSGRESTEGDMTGGRIKKLAQIFEGSPQLVEKEIKPNDQKNNRSSINENFKLSVDFTQSNVTPTESRDKEGGVSYLKICDKCTQTDWSDILLEARRHEGDYYTFHLPSLQFLKQCNL